MANVTFVSRRDSSFRAFPPASAQLAVVLPFFGELAIWIRRPGAPGWLFPAGARRSGETILEVARRELWDSTRLVTKRLDLLGAIRQDGPTPSTAYVYMCEAAELPWSYDLPHSIGEVGVFRTPPAAIAADWSGTVLEYAARARRLGLR